jgi:acyl-CoA thioesterase FadM
VSRVKLTELSLYEFCHRLTVRATDINYAVHVGNETMLGLVHEARSQFMAQLGFETIAVKNNDVGLIIADLAVNFKAEAYTHDRLEIDCQIGEIQGRSFRLFHRILRAEQVIALIEPGLVAFDYRARNVVQLPADFLATLENYRADQSRQEMEKI